MAVVLGGSAWMWPALFVVNAVLHGAKYVFEGRESARILAALPPVPGPDSDPLPSTPAL
jgi:hypothetical protein